MPEKEIKVLNHGFVKYIDHMGSDARIAEAARVSYKDAKTRSEDRQLIRYMLSHHHTSPFEQVVFVFHCKMPIFVARQWVRHRTARLNEMSGRYSVLPSEWYTPEVNRLQKQSQTNKQGSAPELIEHAAMFQRSMHRDAAQAFERYEDNLATGMSKEVARVNLPLSSYTEWYWQMDLSNLFKFFALRLDAHAQWEIRRYAEAMYDIVKPIMPLACEAFEDFVLNAKTFSAHEMTILQHMLDQCGAFDQVNVMSGSTAPMCDAKSLTVSDAKLKGRELEEFKAKLGVD